MKILWMTWKDGKNPAVGGAEIVNEELAKRLVQNGHEIIFLVAGFPGAAKEEVVEGFKIIRLGNRYSVYWKVYQFYKKNLIGWADLVIDEVNTVPFFAKFYIQEKNVLFVHQLCREIWFFQMIFPLNLIGYILEPIYLWLLRDRETITVSESSKKDLEKFGFKKEMVGVISEGIEINPVDDLKIIEKYPAPTILALGTVRSMKRTKDMIRAFEIAKEKIKDLELIVAGYAGGKYGQETVAMINCSPFKESVKFLGRVDIPRKIELLQKSHLLFYASVKEGWGLIVTEANSQGTPAIVYNVDGLRDSVKNGETGLICDKNTPENMAAKTIEILQDKEKYEKMRQIGWEWSKEINFDRSYRDFKELIDK